MAKADIYVRVLRNDFPRLAAHLPVTADSIVNDKRGPEMADIAALHSRVDTGEMRDGWEWIPTGNGRGRLQNAVAHTPFNEYGTVNMSAQPMARPAAEIILPLILADFRAALAGIGR